MSLGHAILGFLSLEPSTGYTLNDRFSGSVGSFWTATQSQIYRELHALEGRGLVAVDVVPQPGKPAKKVYALTAAGEAELQRWVAQPVGPAQLRDPFLLKFVFAANAPPQVLTDLVAHYASVLTQTRAEYLARLNHPQIFSLARSKREALLWRLSLDNGLSWCDAQLAWAATAQTQLAASPQTPRPKGRTRNRRK